MIQIFDQVNGKPVPSVHCRMVREFRDVIDFYPEDYLQVLYYIQAITCLDASINIYVHQPEDMREEIVVADIGPLKFDRESPIVIAAIDKCKQLYSTPIDTSYIGVKHMVEKIGRMLLTEEIITTGKEANLTAIRGAVKDLPELWKAYKEVVVELQKEQSIARGAIRRAYDAMPGYKNTKTETDGSQESL